jgi:hypothetical protein
MAGAKRAAHEVVAATMRAARQLAAVQTAAREHEAAERASRLEQLRSSHAA